MVPAQDERGYGARFAQLILFGNGIPIPFRAATAETRPEPMLARAVPRHVAEITEALEYGMVAYDPAPRVSRPR